MSTERTEWPGIMLCPLVDRNISSTDCLEICDVCGGVIKESILEDDFKQKPNWRDICRQCTYYG